MYKKEKMYDYKGSDKSIYIYMYINCFAHKQCVVLMKLAKPCPLWYLVAMSHILIITAISALKLKFSR